MGDPSVFVGVPVVVTEKIDGGNTCLWNGEVFARSVDTPATEGWFAMVKKHHGWKTNDEQFRNWAIYGEDIYGIHSIEYAPVQEARTYMLFGIRANDLFFSWRTVEYASGLLDIPTVPVVFRGEFENEDDITRFFRKERKKPSALGGEREGFVMRVAGGFGANKFAEKVCKYVRANHVQTSEHWRRNWKPCRLRG